MSAQKISRSVFRIAAAVTAGSYVYLWIKGRKT